MGCDQSFMPHQRSTPTPAKQQRILAEQQKTQQLKSEFLQKYKNQKPVSTQGWECLALHFDQENNVKDAIKCYRTYILCKGYESQPKHIKRYQELESLVPTEKLDYLDSRFDTVTRITFWGKRVNVLTARKLLENSMLGRNNPLRNDFHLLQLGIAPGERQKVRQAIGMF